MKIDAVVDGRPLVLELEARGADWVVDGRLASLVEVEPGIYSVLMDGHSYEARIERQGDGWAVAIDGRRFSLELPDPRRLRRQGGALHREGRVNVAAPMPGKVVRLLVAEGERVEAGQGIAVIEAMKMQNELKSPKPGSVVSLAAREGATVAAGEVLAVIE